MQPATLDGLDACSTNPPNSDRNHLPDPGYPKLHKEFCKFGVEDFRAVCCSSLSTGLIECTSSMVVSRRRPGYDVDGEWYWKRRHPVNVDGPMAPAAAGHTGENGH